MCGRFACTLDKNDLVRACTYRGKCLASNGITEGSCLNDEENKDVKLKECSKLKKDQESPEMGFGDEDDSFLLEASIPAVDPFTPRNHTAFHYAPFLGTKKEEMVEEEDLKFEEEEDESFLLEASINVESEMDSESNGVDFVPIWLDAPCGGMYKPSSNLPPTSYTPVLYWQDRNEQGPVIQPMLWGLVPPWHRGENPTSHGVSTNNARLEGVQSSKLYGPCLKRRCVVICDGFYEWRKNPSSTAKEKGNKQPFFVYRKGEEKEGQENLKDQSNKDLGEGEDFEGQKPLFMAGIYSVGERAGGSKIYSYSVLTREADSNLSWLHHRMPCFLSPELLHPWLTLSSTKAALDLLLQPTGINLAWHPVSRDVGNVRNQSMDLTQKVEEGEQVAEKNVKKTDSSSASKGLMANWLKRGKTEMGGENTSKRRKND